MITYCDNAVKLIDANGETQIKIVHTGQILNVSLDQLSEERKGEINKAIKALKVEKNKVARWYKKNG